MKKCVFVLIIMLLLTGCSDRDTFETVSDVNAAPVLAVENRLQVSLPDEAALASMEVDDGSKLYLCDGYIVTLQKLSAGDLDRTLRETTGFGRDGLMVMETAQGDWKRYECVWSAAGEGETQVCRAAILDDGCYHHIVTVMADYSSAGDLSNTWQHILDSASLVSTG